MTTSTDTAPEQTAAAPEETTSTPAREAKHRHRTVRHVAVHGGSAGAVSAAAEVLHVFGPSALGLGVAGVAAAGAGVVAVRKRRKAGRAQTRRASLVRTTRRSTKTASGSRAGAGLGRSKGSAGASGRARTAPPRSPRRAAGSGRAAGVGRTGRHAGAGSGAVRSRALRRRRGKPSTAATRAAIRSRRPRPATPAGHRGRPADASKRRQARAARTQDAAKTRPTGTRPGPATRMGKTGQAASRNGRHAARLTRRQAMRVYRLAKASGKATRPYLRVRPPANQAPNTKPAQENATTPKKNAAPKTAQKAVKKTTARPGRAITAPGLTAKDIMDVNAPSAGITAVADAIREHIAAFEPENALEIGGFLAGLDNLFTELGSGLISAADKLGGDHPVDQSVVDHLHQLGAHAITLADWGTQTHALFRAAHESEINRLENPRAREEDWDVERNR